jgi:hypothetical protein
LVLKIALTPVEGQQGECGGFAIMRYYALRPPVGHGPFAFWSLLAGGLAGLRWTNSPQTPPKLVAALALNDLNQRRNQRKSPNFLGLHSWLRVKMPKTVGFDTVGSNQWPATDITVLGRYTDHCIDYFVKIAKHINSLKEVTFWALA